MNHIYILLIIALTCCHHPSDKSMLCPESKTSVSSNHTNNRSTLDSNDNEITDIEKCKLKSLSLDELFRKGIHFLSPSTYRIAKRYYKEAIMDGICYETPSTKKDEKQVYGPPYKSFTEEAIMDGICYETPSTKKGL